jgi:MoxR-like ATPase
MPGLIRAATLRDAAKAAQSPDIRNILIAGPPGVGKTTFAFLMADLLDQPAWKVQCHAESTPAEIWGMYVPDGTSFRWEAGPVDLAYSRGGILILDEIIEASGPVKTALYGALDHGMGGTISYVGRTFTPSDKYGVLATMNGWPYEGGLPEALLDRFDATFCVLMPGEQQLKTLEPDLRSTCSTLYAQAKDPMLGPEVTYRMLRALQNLRRILPLDLAVLSACHGNEKLAGSLLESLALTTPSLTVAPAVAPATMPADDEEDDEEDEDDDGE